MLGEKGFNEIDMALLKHLLFNKKPLAFVRTQCDSAIVGIQDKFESQVILLFFVTEITVTFIQNPDQEMTFEQALNELRRVFGDYIKDQVLTKAKIGHLGK